MGPFPLPPGFRKGGRFATWQPDVPRYLVADVDGTLVGADGTVSPEVIAAAERARTAGLTMGFATGRMHLAVAALHEHLELPGPHVFHNGADVRLGGQSVARWPLGAAGVRATYAIAHRLGLYVELYLEDGYLVSALDERARPHWDLMGFPPLHVASDAEAVAGRDVIKATFALFDPTQVEAVVAAIDAAGLAAGPAHSPATPGISYVNVTSAAASKGTALVRAAEAIGVDLAAVVAIGDAHNDLPMLAVAGTAVAMGQAHADVVAAAHLVAPDVRDHGVAATVDACLSWRS